ncbi:olfactory receptor 51E1-like [Mixophyes fleayi]|uniref:olfactory receptor 51E1-like n=1 Tax=Mixophyes fleayi TaxID=3061075 RepID=UPI003F4D7E49
MLLYNKSICSNSSVFILSGIPSLDDYQFWIGFPLFSIYMVAVIGNLSLLYIIKVDEKLHEPMYIFLFMLSAIDLFIATTAMPRMLGIFWFDTRQITFNMCLTQMFFLHFLSAIESGILVAMAVDRYVAICHPLRYSSILTSETIMKISSVILVRGAAVMIPFPLIIKRFPLWKHNHLTHSYCLQQEVMNFACADIRVNIIYGLFGILSVMGIDSLFISMSYLLIINTIVDLAEDANLKAFSTCAAHICAVLIYYIPLIGLSVVHRFKFNSTQNLHILFGNIYLLLPPVINPLIYGIKTKQIRSRFSKLFIKTTTIQETDTLCLYRP